MPRGLARATMGGMTAPARESHPAEGYRPEEHRRDAIRGGRRHRIVPQTAEAGPERG